MQTRLSSVQQALLGLLVATFAIVLIARPAPTNGRLRLALEELQTFRSRFDRTQVEQALLENARAQGRHSLAELVAATPRGPQLPALQVANAAQPVQPLASLQLSNLAEVAEFAQPNRSITLGVADIAALGRSLAWRLAETPADSPVTLEQVQLSAAAINEADLQLEIEVAQLQAERLEASTAVDAAKAELDAADARYDQQRKWKLPWKVLAKTREVRQQAKGVLAEKQHTLKALERRYATARKRTTRSYEPRTLQPIPSTALAQVSVSQAGKQTLLQIPVAMTVRAVPVQSLNGAALPYTHEAGLWDEVRALDADRAIDAVRAHFNWHFRSVELLGIRLGGMTVLQLVPCILPLLLAASLLRMRAVAGAYNPFTTRVRGTLPRIGFGSRVIDLLVLVVLPLAAAGCAMTSLVLVGQVPALPVLTAVACLVLGIHTFTRLGELQNLREDVVRSHSYPPPEDS